jgi:hypothetical protein
VLTFVIAVSVLRTVRTALRPPAPPAALTAGESAKGSLPAPGREPLLAAVQTQPLVQTRLEPEMASRVLRAWAREGA